MKNRVICLCAIFLTFLSVPVFSQVADLSKTNYGIWQSYGDPVSSAINPEIRGRLCNFRWADIQPAPDKWVWKLFDQGLASRAADGLPIIFMVYTEEDAPEWLYSNGVPKVAMKDKNGNIMAYTPYFADPKYKDYFREMITKVHQHIETLPAYIRNQIIAVQGCFGSTGDYISYKGDVDPQYKIGANGFFELFKEFSTYYYEEYRNTNPKIYLLSNPKNNGPDQATWVFQNCPGGWIKTGTLGKGFQLNDENDKAEWLYPLLNKEFNGQYIRARSEITGGATTAGWWNRAPAKNMFALLCYDIYWGLDWSNQGYEQIADKTFDSAYGFYNRYAGEKEAAKSIYAMCALRDGLDAHDTVRFPVSKYGFLYRGNSVRFINIANAFGDKGAMLEDVQNAMGDEMNNVGSKGINDVGWNIFPGNYDRFLHQLMPNETSVGYWNVPSANKSDMFGKYARGFDLANGKDALYFDVEDAYFNGTPLNKQYPVVVEVVYLDNGYGSFQLFYDGADNHDKPSVNIKCTNTKVWKRASVTLNDAYMGNQSLYGSDFYIKNTGSQDVIFSIVEFRRPYQGETVGFSASKVPGFPTVCANSNSVSYQALYLSGSFLSGGDVVVGPLKGFSFSADSGKTYPDSVIIKDVGGAFSKKLFIKFKPDAAAVYDGNIPVKGAGINSIDIPVQASAVSSSPALQTFIKPVSCKGGKDGSIDLVTTGGTGPFSYSWAGPNFLWLTTEDISKLSAGNYSITVKSLGGCVTKSTLVVTEPDSLNVVASALPIANNQTSTTVTISASGGTTPYLGTGTFNAEAGTYLYTVTDANGCNATANLTINPGSNKLTAFAAQKSILCHGGYTTVTITGAGGTAPYKGTGDFVVSAGTHSFTITDANGATSTVSVSLSEPPVLKASVTSQNILCNGGTANILVNATGGVAPYTGTGNFTVSAGVYTYTVTDANGCPAVKTISLSQPSPLQATAVAQPFDNKDSTTIVNVNASGGVAPYTGTGNFVVGAGDYTYNITDANGCSTSASVDVTNNAVFTAHATAGNITCYGGTTTVTVSVTGGTAPFTGTGTFTVSAGTYTYNVSDANGNTCSATVTVADPALLQINSITKSDVSSCKLQTGSIIINTTGGTAPYEYTLNSGAYQSSNIFQNLSEGNYIVIAKDNNGCIATAPAVLTKSTPMEAWFDTVEDVSNCALADGSVTVTNHGGVGPFTYSLNGGSFQTSNTFTKLPQSDYNVTVMDSRGCETIAFTTIKKDAPITLTASDVSQVSACGNSDGSITLDATGGGGKYEYSLNGQAFKAVNKFTNLSEGDYTITVRDCRGCTKSITVNLVKIPALVAKIQNVVNAEACTNNGTIIAGLQGGSGPYLYNVNGGVFQPESAFTNLGPGIYTLQVKDGRGCTATTFATLTQAEGMKVSATKSDISCKGGSDGTITISNAGGIAPLQYSIDGKPFIPRNVFGNLKAGSHNISIKDSKNCSADITVTILDGKEICTNGQDISGTNAGLRVTVLPNPSPTEFTLLINSYSDEQVHIFVMDMTGKIVYKTDGNVYDQYHFGSNLAAGMYAVRVIQGSTTKTVKVIKTK